MNRLIRILAAWAGALPATRFALSSRTSAFLVLILVAAGVGYGVVLRPTVTGPGISASSSDPQKTDTALYKAIIYRVAAGQSYYDAAVIEHRERNYPLRPFVTVRLPTLAFFDVVTGPIFASLSLCLLTVVTWMALARRLFLDLGPGRPWLYASTLAAVGVAPSFAEVGVYWHEVWAALLMTLSFATRSSARWSASVALGLAAVATRELALPYLCVMAFAASIEGNRREAAAWLAAIGAFAAMLIGHWWMLSQLVVASDLHSPGWTAAGGWRFVLQIVRENTILIVAAWPVVAMIVPMSLLGWAGWRGPLAMRGALLLGGYAVAFMIVGRPDNVYWGLMLGPLLLVGLVFAPGAIRDLIVAAARRSRDGRGARLAVPSMRLATK